MTTAEQNTELDYIICEAMDITMDELDQLSLPNLEYFRDQYRHLLDDEE
jgi:hypothetical protein